MKVMSVIDKNNNVLMKQKLAAMPLKEEYITEKSIEMFGDPEPCIIHKSAVMKKVYLEFELFFKPGPGEKIQEIPVERIPYNIVKSVDIDFACVRYIIV